jgi:hypothetical protein
MLKTQNLTQTRFWLSVLMLTALATARIVDTYDEFSQFFDEPYHIASGMQWLEKGVYVFERMHPPVARIAIALPLYLQGVRGHSQTVFTPKPGERIDVNEEARKNGNQILLSRDGYDRNLFWARAGNLPMFWLSVLLLALWVRLWYGSWIALTVVALYTMIPQVLGNAGMATTDTAATTGFLAGLYGFAHWVNRPDLRRAAWFGASLGFAAICKFSTLPFLLVGFTLTLAWAWIRGPELAEWHGFQRGHWVRSAILATAVAVVVIWLPYRFHMAPLLTGHGIEIPTERLGPLKPAGDWALNTPVPLGEFLGGLGAVYIRNKVGSISYLMGQFRIGGWLAYFPVGMAVKTPLSFLFGLLLGLPLAVQWLFQKDLKKAILPLFLIAIFSLGITARINIGIRHMLPSVPLLALIVVAGWVDFRARLASRPRLWATLAGLWVVAVVAESASAHPDYGIWFNALAGSHPENILVDADLDGGQDLKRLERRLREKGIDRVKIAYFGSADLGTRPFTGYEKLTPEQRPSGWIAISAMELVEACLMRKDYCWLHKYTPVERIGQSIFLFDIPPAVPAANITPTQ